MMNIPFVKTNLYGIVVSSILLAITLISLLWNTIFGLASRDGSRSYTIDITERISGLTSFHHPSPHVDPVSIILILFVSFILYSTRSYNSKGN